MNSVDFLPNDYRRQAADRRSHVWLLVALVIYGGFVGALATHQLQALRAVQQRYDRVEKPFGRAQLANSRFAELESQLAKINGQAELHTYLRHPWPRTRVLAALIEHLPPEVRLTDVTMHREERNHRENRTAPPRSGIAKKQEDTSKKPDARQSLRRLRGEFDTMRTLVSVRGVTSDNSALHRCIRALGESRLFAKADLESLDSIEDDIAPGTASFEMCVELAPGYGQTDGPAEGPSERRTS